MIRVYVIQSAEGHFLSKQGEWLSGKTAGLIFFGKYRDEALNRLIDITINDVNVRAKVVETELNSKKHPELDIIVEHDLHEPNLDLDLETEAFEEHKQNIA